jgi:hypothetical protein
MLTAWREHGSSSYAKRAMRCIKARIIIARLAFLMLQTNIAFLGQRGIAGRARQHSEDTRKENENNPCAFAGSMIISFQWQAMKLAR